jgi:hypothetical protein
MIAARGTLSRGVDHARLVRTNPAFSGGGINWTPAVGVCGLSYSERRAVELRTTNSGSMAISGTQSSCSSIRFNKVRAAISPIFWSGWRTVVRLGLLCRAI